MELSTLFRENRTLSLFLSFLSILSLYKVCRYHQRRADFATKRRQYGCEAAPFYPHKDPFFGLDYLWVNFQALKNHRFLEKWTSHFQNINGGVRTYCYHTLGKTVICTIEPENIKSVWVTDLNSYSLTPQRSHIFRSVIGKGIMSTNGSEWEESRMLLRPHFSRVQKDLPAIENNFRNLINVIREEGYEVDLQKLLPRYTTDVSAEVFYGESTNSLLEDGDIKAKRFAATFDKISRLLSEYLRVSELMSLRPSKDLKRGVQYLNDFMAEKVKVTMEKRRIMSREKRDTLDKENEERERHILIDELAKSGATAEQIRSELLAVIIAGRDTASGFLILAFYQLARHPEVCHKLREEIQEQIGQEVPSLSQLVKLKYLRWTLNEVNGRTAVEDTTIPLGGGPDGRSPVFVPRGTKILTLLWALHRREDIYGPDAHEFNPERWETLKPK